MTTDEAPRDRLARLRVLADDLETRIGSEDSGAAVASLSRVLVTVLEQIDELAPPPAKKETTLDEIGDRRRARGAAAAGVSGSRRGGAG